MSASRPNTRVSQLALASAVVLLAACGGGGSDEPDVVVPSAVRTVAASAASDTGADTLSLHGGALARAVLSVAGDGAFDVTGRREQPQTLGAAGGSAPLHARLAKALLKRGATTAAARERPAAISSETVACENVGGSMLVTVNDADDNNKLSADDTVAIQANNCVVDVSLPAASGNLSMAINAVALDGDDIPSAIDATITVNSFTIGGYGSFSGTIRLWSKPEGGLDRTRVSYRAVNVAVAGTTVVYDFDIYGLGGNASTTFDLNGGLGIGGQTYAVVAGTVMSATGTNPPASGTVSLRDAAGDAVRLTARSATTFDLDFLPSGSTTPTASLTEQSWAEYSGI